MFAVPGWNITAKPIVQDHAKLVRENASTRKRKHNAPDGDQKSSNAQRDKKPKLTLAGHAGKNGIASRRAVRDRSRGNSRKADPRLKQTGANNEPLGLPRVSGTGRNNEAKHEIVQQAHNQHAHAKKTLTEHENSTVKLANPAGPNGTRQANSERNKTNRKILRQDKPHSQKSQDGDAKASGDSSTGTTLTTVPTVLPPAPPTKVNLTPLQQKMRAKLISSRFRHLNEQLYTTESSTALSLFQSQPELFSEYHAGFSQQVKDSWPSNPVDEYISIVKQRGVIRQADNTVIVQLPRRKGGLCTIADLGCGDAPLARGLQTQVRNLNVKLHNFDLHASNPQVTVADIAKLPLQDGEVDVAIFCLSLMGTNWLAFVEEAWRILRGDGKGEVWVAEVKSRFGRKSAKKASVVENSVGKRRKAGAGVKKPREDVDPETEIKFVDEQEGDVSVTEDDTDLHPFIEVFQRRGFVLREESVDTSNKMFVSMVFMKAGVPKAGRWKGMKYNGKEYVRLEDKRPQQQQPSQLPPQKGRFQRDRRFDVVDEVDETQESKVLKPCVYKLR